MFFTFPLSQGINLIFEFVFQDLFGEFQLEFFTEPEILQLQSKLNHDVQSQAMKILTRNKNIPIPYTLLLPDKITATLGM